MNKLFNKIAAGVVGLAMAVGVGVAVGGQSSSKSNIAKAANITTTWDATAEGFTDQQQLAGQTYSFVNPNVSITFGSATGNGHKYYTNGTAIRSYGDNSFTISCSAGNLTSITLSNDQSKTVSADVGTYSNNSWTGSAASVTFTVASGSGNFRTSTISAVYESSGGGGGTLSGTATYTVTSTSAVAKTGSAPAGSSASYSQTYTTTMGQMTKNNSITLTLSGYDGAKIKAASVSVHSNKSGGSGSLSLVSGSSTIASIAASQFNSANWHGAWSQTYVTKTLTVTETTIADSASIVLTISATANSLFFESLSITWESEQSSQPTYTDVTISLGSLTGTYKGEAYIQASATVQGTNNPSQLVSWFITSSSTFADSSSVTGVASIDSNGKITFEDNGTVYVWALAADDTTHNSVNVTATANGLVAKPGSESDPYSVAEARSAAAGEDSAAKTNVYTVGIVSEILEPYNSQYKNITFTISTDGDAESEQIEAYRCKSGTNNTYAETVVIGDTVLLKGNLKVFGGKPEYDPCTIESLTHPTAPSVKFIYSYGNILVGETKTYAAVGNNLGGAAISYSSSDTSKATVNSSTGEVTALALGDTTITATATVSGTAYSGSYTLHVVEPKTVTQAKSFIDAGVHLKDNYVTGTISQIVSESVESGSITYKISDDGTTTSQQLQVYKGKNIGGESYTALTDVAVGDHVVVWGELTIYNSEYQFNNGNRLISTDHEQGTTYTVTYNANGGECATSSESIIEGGHPTFPSATRSGYTFDGWQVTGDSTYYTSENANLYTVEDDVTFVAHWTEKAQSDSIVISADYLQISDEYTSQQTFEATDGIEYIGAPSSGNKIKAQAVSGDNKFADENTILIGKEGAYLYNHTAFDYPIKTLKVYLNGGNVSVKSIVAVGFGTSEVTDELTGGTALDVKDTAFDFTLSDMSADYTYFRLQVMNGYNAQIQIEVTLDIPSYTASDFADEFLETLSTGSSHVCDAQGNTNLSSLKAEWKTFAGKWTDVSDKTAITGVTPSESGDKYQKTLALYRYIAEKYNTQLQDSELTDYNFMGIQDLNPRSSGRVSIFGDVDTQSGTAVAITVASILSVAALGGYFFLKKKKVTK